MKTITINDNQKGLLFRNGRFERLLEAGKYHLFGSRQVEILSVEMQIASKYCTLETLLTDAELKESVVLAEVPDGHIALHFEDGRYVGWIDGGKHAFWQAGKAHEFQIVDITVPDVDPAIPVYILQTNPGGHIKKVMVEENERGLLYVNGRFTRLLEPGVHWFWTNMAEVLAYTVDMRLQQKNITGQEILTQDKVPLRINFVCDYRITDPVKANEEIESYEEQFHVAAQMALREYVGRYKLDEILENKEGISAFVLQRLKEREAALYLEIKSAGVKDIILPGEIRSIMNEVVAAEKKAQANVITRREEVASTRSLLNTAKLMDENQTLYRLKEMEYLERICANIGDINIGANQDVLGELLKLFGRKSA